MSDFPETHQWGKLSVENAELVAAALAGTPEIDFGIQVSHDGRVWVCINGMAWLRFKPSKPRPYEGKSTPEELIAKVKEWATTYQAGEGDFYMGYDSAQQSVKDLIEWEGH